MVVLLQLRIILKLPKLDLDQIDKLKRLELLKLIVDNPLKYLANELHACMVQMEEGGFKRDMPIKIGGMVTDYTKIINNEVKFQCDSTTGIHLLGMVSATYDKALILSVSL